MKIILMISIISGGLAALGYIYYDILEIYQKKKNRKEK